jgi:hypothetical protein
MIPVPLVPPRRVRWNTLSFGPAVVENGEIVDGIEGVEVDTIRHVPKPRRRRA